MKGEVVIPPSTADEQPRVTVELVMMEKLVSAHLESITPKQRRRFLKALFAKLSVEEMDAIPLRDRAFIEAKRKKERGAVAWARSMLPAWMLPPR